MDDKPAVTAPTIASSMDAQGYVVVWDHGPQADDGPTFEADRKAWQVLHGDEPWPIRMDASDAAHAMERDPDRYSLEPDGVDEGAVAAKVKEIQDRRAAVAKAAEVRAAALQLAADRKEAIGALMAERRSKAETEQAKPVPPKPTFPPWRSSPAPNPGDA